MIYFVHRCFVSCADIDFSFLSEPLSNLASKSPSGFVIVLTLAIILIVVLSLCKASIKHYRKLAELSMSKTEEAYRNAFLLASNNREKIDEINSKQKHNNGMKK